MPSAKSLSGMMRLTIKRVLSAAGRAAIARAARKRWAKVRKQAKKIAALRQRGRLSLHGSCSRITEAGRRYEESPSFKS
jgi:hypothetical protein